MSQSDLQANTCSSCQARENTCQQVVAKLKKFGASFESIKTHPEIRSIMRTLTSHLQTLQLFLVHRAPSSYLTPSITHFFCCNASEHLHCIGTNSSMVGWESQKGLARTDCSTTAWSKCELWGWKINSEEGAILPALRVLREAVNLQDKPSDL